MNVFFMSTAIPDETYEHIVNNCKTFKPTYSGVGFDRNIAEGLTNFTEVKVVSLAPIPSYPKFKSLIWRKKNKKVGNLNYYIPGMLNLPIFKEIWFMSSVLKQLIKWYREGNNKSKVILLSGLFRCYIIPAAIIKKLFGVKVYAIVPDIPEIMTTYRKDYSYLRQLLNKVEVKVGKRYRKRIDGFILLSKHMNSLVNKTGAPYLVVDGMFKKNNSPEGSKKQLFVTNKKTIMYAGKLSIQFGIDKLISAFLKADIKNCELLLYGDGDYVPYIKGIVKDNSNIIYGGVISHDKVLEEEKRVDLLVDPRPSDLILSKMAFPSKIIEYMASGTPVLTTNLPCFGSDYAKYQYRFHLEDIDGMADKLKEVITLEKNELETFGERAKEFVLSEKTVNKQCEKIYRFIKAQLNK